MHQIITQASIEDDKLGGDNCGRQPAGGPCVRQAWSAKTGHNRQSFEDPEKIVASKSMTETVAKFNSIRDKRTQTSSIDSNTLNHPDTVNFAVF